MCGIVALVEPSSPPWLGSAVRAMTRLIRHRGPDGEGVMFFSGATGQALAVRTSDTPAEVAAEPAGPPGVVLGFGHRRLSIVDRSSAGHQPMCDAQGRRWITFNGEIYNHLELRQELTARGHSFRSQTDTEVILAAWHEWGDQCLARFNGMFAFALFDLATRRLFIARDRFGVKPLYLWRTPTGGIAFASEIKSFTAHPGWRAQLNGQRAYEFLNWGISDHTEETLFKGVHQLRGGEAMSFALDAVPAARPHRWYDLLASAPDGNGSAPAEKFRMLFDDAVRLRLRADVPVGSCLSGGLDSSSIVCTVRKQLAERGSGLPRTFSAYSDVAEFDERSFLQEVVSATDAEASHVTPAPNQLLQELDTIVWHQDEPFISTSVYAQWCVFRLAGANGVIVMLDGQGADEALAGYHGFFDHRIASLLRRGQLLAGWREAAIVREVHGQRPSQQAMQLADILLPNAATNLLRRVAGRTVHTPEFLDLERFGAVPTSPRLLAPCGADSVTALSRAQLTAFNLPMLLRYEDRDSMAHGVEARLPFLDYRLVEFCLGLPEHEKIGAGWTKRVLREAMRGRVPERVRTRRDKLGFATAEETWMKQRERGAFRLLLKDSLDATRNWLTAAANAKAQRILEGAERFSFLPWRFISFGQWVKKFAVQPA